QACGAANPFIESASYVGGQVRASKRASYADLLAAGKDEKSIVALMDHQHRTMIAARRHRKFGDTPSSRPGPRPARAAAAPAGPSGWGAFPLPAAGRPGSSLVVP